MLEGVPACEPLSGLGRQIKLMGQLEGMTVRLSIRQRVPRYQAVSGSIRLGSSLRGLFTRGFTGWAFMRGAE